MEILASHPHYAIEETDEGVIFVRVEGSASASEVDEFFGVFQPILEERAPARVLIDGSGIADATLSARWKLSMRMKGNRPLILRSAVYGLSGAFEAIARVVLRASGRTNVKTFPSRGAAEAWLQTA